MELVAAWASTALAGACYVWAVCAGYRSLRHEPMALVTSGAVPRLVLSAAALVFLSRRLLGPRSVACMSPVEWSIVYSVHVFNLSGACLAPALLSHLSPRPAKRSFAWALSAAGVQTVGSLAEIIAHYQDGFVYGPVSQFGILNFTFSVCLVAQFACTARAMHRGFWTSVIAWTTMAALGVVYILGHYLLRPSQTKIIVFNLQLVSVCSFALAYWSRTRTIWFMLTIALAMSIIRCTLDLKRTNNQWLHMCPGVWAWLSYVVPLWLATLSIHTPLSRRSYWDHPLFVLVTSLAVFATSLLVQALVASFEDACAFETAREAMIWPAFTVERAPEEMSERGVTRVGLIALCMFVLVEMIAIPRASRKEPFGHALLKRVRGDGLRFLSGVPKKAHHVHTV